jgi:aspartyl-tRNA(Asn)/glutamyl-tRNA(Gln) amidotransferase subunit C
MTVITKDEVRKLAKIAAIKVAEDEVDELTQEIHAVLTYVSSLKEVPQGQGIEMPRTINRMRSDVTQPFDAEVLLENAPQREGPFFVVPIIKQ